MTQDDKLKARIAEALEKGPPDGLTGPQLHSVVAGSWEQVKAALEEMVDAGELRVPAEPTAEEPYARYAIAA